MRIWHGLDGNGALGLCAVGYRKARRGLARHGAHRSMTSSDGRNGMVGHSVARLVTVRIGMDAPGAMTSIRERYRAARRGLATVGMGADRIGMVVQGAHAEMTSGRERYGIFGWARHAVVWRGPARSGTAGRGEDRQGARHEMTSRGERYGWARQVEEWHGLAAQGGVRRREARHGKDPSRVPDTACEGLRLGRAFLGKAMPGWARRGLAGQGQAWARKGIER